MLDRLHFTFGTTLGTDLMGKPLLLREYLFVDIPEPANHILKHMIDFPLKAMIHTFINSVMLKTVLTLVLINASRDLIFMKTVQ